MANVILIKNLKEDDLKKGEIIIKAPDFLHEIDTTKNTAKIGGKLVTTLFFLKEIVNKIKISYDKDNFMADAKIPFNKYVGIPYKDSKDLSDKILIPLLKKYYSDVFYKYLDHKIKTRPANVETIFFNGDESLLDVFLNNGINRKTIAEHKKTDDKKVSNKKNKK